MRLIHLKLSITITILFACSIARASATEITVSAAMSLKETFSEIAKHFEETHPGDKVSLNFGSSGDLAQQVVHGAPVDVYASSGASPVKKLMDAHLLEGEPKSFTQNALVVIKPKESKTQISSLKDLESLEAVAIGDPVVNPSGEYARQALQHIGIFDKLLHGNHLVFAQNVRQCLNYVEKQSVGAGIVYATDAKTSSSIETCFTVPKEYCDPIKYQIAIVKGSKQARLGQEFVDMVMGKFGQDAFKKRGFI